MYMSNQAVQNDSPIGGSFWQKDSLITHILFELWLIMIFSPVANFVQQALICHFIRLYLVPLSPYFIQFFCYQGNVNVAPRWYPYNINRTKKL